MEVSELTLKLIILLAPGALASIIFEKLTVHKKWTSFQFIANSILFGAASYLITQLLLNWTGNNGGLDNFWKNLSTKEIPYKAVLNASFFSIVIGLACSALDYYKVINRFAKYLKLTTKYGDENLYSYFLNAKNVEEIYFRDIANNLTYHGLVNSFSETSEFKEIVLTDVKVYNYTTSELAYKIDILYLSRPKDQIIIEVPFLKTKTQTNGKEADTKTAE